MKHIFITVVVLLLATSGVFADDIQDNTDARNANTEARLNAKHIPDSTETANAKQEEKNRTQVNYIKYNSDAYNAVRYGATEGSNLIPGKPDTTDPKALEKARKEQIKRYRKAQKAKDKEEKKSKGND